VSPIAWVLWFVYITALVAIVIGIVWTVVLYVAGGKYLARLRDAPAGDESKYLWVFLVPALNEGVTIADSVSRLRAAAATHKILLVINDGSDDDTGAVLESVAGPDLEVLTRVAPNARKGKAAALNAAFAHLVEDVLNQPRYGRWDRENVIVAIVDADGRLAPGAPSYVARRFDRPEVGGVQVSVEIYNQDSWLTRMQGLEFRTFGGMFQVGRSQWGVAFMGGNGQFNRMTALQSVSSGAGPWSDFLTEDQELGLRLLERGWLGMQEPFTHVSQQGLNKLRPLYRQRTRWMQGNIQVFGNLHRLHSHHLVGLRRWDALFTLTMPIFQVIIGLATVIAVVLALFFGVNYVPWSGSVPWRITTTTLFLVLGLGPTSMGILVLGRGQGWRAIPRVVALAPSYIAYTWLMWPVTFRGLYRQFRGQRAWAKTAREAITRSTPAQPGHEVADSA